MTATDTDTSERAPTLYPPVVPDDPPWRRYWDKVRNPEAAIGFFIVAACVAFVITQLQPSQLLRNTTPAGGDMGAHVWLPDFVKRGLLPHLRITGWSPDWYNGFPALTYYFPGPIVAIALLSYILPYNIAFKLVTVVGLIALPVAAWAFGRLARMRYPGAVVLAVAAIPYLFARDYTIYGGNIGSTMAGEFCFSIGLALALVFLGLVARGLEDGRHRAIAAVTLAAVGVCHILPLLFAILGAIVLTIMRFDRHRLLKWALPVIAVGGALTAFWALPFELRLPYATDMKYEKVTTYVATLFPSKDLWLFVLAGTGALLSIARRNRAGVFFTVMGVLSALIFRIAPQYRLWNARVLPFWYLCLYFLAAIALLEIGLSIVDALRTYDRPRPSVAGTVSVGIVTFLVALTWVNFPLHNLPFGHTTASGKYTWLGITTSETSYDPDWVYWNYSGYQSPTKSRRNEYFALVNEMKKLGQDPLFGCGRAMWEYEPELDQMGTPDALMLLPFWTHGCIGSQEGLYYESSATTPYHFLNAAELSDHPSNPVRGLTYPGAPDVTIGVQHLEMLGVRYFMALTPDVQSQADQNSDLQLVATVGPYPVTYTSGGSSQVQQRTWKIYQVANSDLVTPLLYQPVVMNGASAGQKWLTASQSWYLDPNRWDVYETAAGPKSWTRVSPTDSSPPRITLPPVLVSNIHEGNESISFNVDQTGVPVLVKTSYFPNWQASGARGPYRVTPNLMVVIPTSNHVTLNYGYTLLDWSGFILSLLGIAAVVVLWRLRPVAYPVPRHFGGRLMSARGLFGPTGKVRRVMAPSEAATLDTVFKAYDIRGIVPDQLGPELARAVGAAFARFAGAANVLVARDMRPSGEELSRAFAEGVASVGVDVIDLGLTSTDEMYFASGFLNSPGAMFTASHNPAHYNGIKLCLAGARPVGADTGLREIKASIISGNIFNGEVGRTGTVTRQDVLADYAAKVRSFVDQSALRPLKVVADTANGMGGLVVPAVFQGLPFSLEVLFGELDGTFPNHPADPIQSENLVALQHRILETGADVGLAFDGDADRCFLVDDRGEPVSGSTTTALVAAALLEKNPGATILYNLICSKAVPEIVRERGGVPVRTRVGHSFIKAVMADTGALFGGEHSGHYYFRDNYRADSGSIAALVVLEVLSRSARPLSELRKQFERYADSGEINTEVADPGAVIEGVAARYSAFNQDRLDGLTVDLGDWWFNLRPSNTEPLLRLNVEAPDRAGCDARTAEVLAVVRELAGANRG